MSYIRKAITKYNNLSLPLKAAVCFFICNIFQKGVSIITTPIFTRLLTTAEYGIFNTYISWRDILSIFITFGLASSVYQKKLVELDKLKQRNVLTSSLQGLATTTAIVSFVVYFVFRNQLNEIFTLDTGYILLLYISSLMTTAFDFWAMRKRVDYEYKKLVPLTVFVVLSKPICGIIAIHYFPENKVFARVVAIVIVEVAAYFILYINNMAIGKTYYHKEYWHYAIVYVLPLVPHYLSQRILSQSDRIMIRTMVGSGEAGIYSLAHSIGWLLTLIISACDSVTAPWTYKKIKERDTYQLGKFSIYPLAGFALAGIAFIFIVPEMLSLFAPDEYYEAVYAIPPLVISTYLMLVYSFFIYFEYYFEKTKFIMIATVASAVLNLILNFVCIKLFGYLAAAYTTMACYAFYTIAHYFVYSAICKKEFNCKSVYNIRLILIISLVFIGVSIGIMFLYSIRIIRYILVAVMMIIAFLYRKKILFFVKTLSKERGGKL